MTYPSSDSSAQLLFNVAGNNNKIPGKVFTDVNKSTQFNLELDSRIDRHQSKIHVTLTYLSDLKTMLDICQDQRHATSPQHAFFYSEDLSARYDWEVPMEVKKNPPTMFYPVTETMVLKFPCLTSCHGKKRLFLVFRLYDGEHKILAKKEIEIKVINNPTTRENDAAKALLLSESKPASEAGSSSLGKRKSQSGRSVTGGTEVFLSFEKKQIPDIQRILRETMEPAFKIANTEVRRTMETCMDKFMQQIAAANPTTEGRQVPLDQRLTPNMGVPESENKLCEMKLTMPANMKPVFGKNLDSFFTTSIASAEESKVEMLQKLRDVNMAAVEMATSMKHGDDHLAPLMNGTVAETSTGVIGNGTTSANDLNSCGQLVNGEALYQIIPINKVAHYVTDEDDNIIQLVVSHDDLTMSSENLEIAATNTTQDAESSIEQLH